MLEGTKLGRYEIREKIGAGGMGEVYLAHDEQLDRLIALKVLLPEISSNSERVQRFKLEAKAASALNHPNIITIHEIGEAENRVYISTEYVNGETLRQKIETGELNVLDAVKIAGQIADSLAVAHESHIVHRDIKPENIMIRRDGYVKILDFGLAKSILYRQPGREEQTMQMINTQPGMVMGSVRYMSPEQARGKEVDARTDVWSLGVVLYEMLSGKNPFDGETASDSIAALIHLEPSPLTDFPADLQEIVKKALRKNVDDRYQTVKDFGLDLHVVRNQLEHDSGEQKHFSAGSQAKTSTVRKYDTSENKTLIQPKLTDTNLIENAAKITRDNLGRKRSLWRFLPLIIAAAAFALAFGAWYSGALLPQKRLPSFESFQVTRLTENGRTNSPSISPDGKYIAFVSEENGLRSLVVRQTANGGAVQIVAPTNLFFQPPTFSADGNYVYYVVNDSGIGTLYQIPTLGGAAKKIITDVDSRITISPDSKRFAFIRHDAEKVQDALVIANIDGTQAQPFLTTREANSRRFSDIGWSTTEDKILIGSIDKVITENLVETKLLMFSPADKSFAPFGNQNWLSANSFAWSGDGTEVYFVGKTKAEEARQIWRISYPSAETKQVSSDSNGYDSMSLASAGDALVASKQDIMSSVWRTFPKTSNLEQITAESRIYEGERGLTQFSDGRLLLTKNESRQVNLWVMNEDGTGQKQLTADAGTNIHPVVSTDQKHIIFASNRTGKFCLWRMNLDGSNTIQLTNPNGAMDFRPQILKDGKTIVFERNFDDRNNASLIKVSIDGKDESPVFPESQMSRFLPRISNDGKWMAFTEQSFDAANLVFNSSIQLVNLQFDDGNFLPSREIKEDIGYFRWTKDNKNLTYIGTQGVQNLFNYSLESSAKKQLTNFNSGVILNFSWGRDGMTLFIVRGIVNSDLILLKDNGKSRS